MGWCEKLPDGRWRAYESEGSGADRVRASAVRTTRTEARLAAKYKLTAKRKVSSLEPHNLTLAAYLARWIGHERTQSRTKHSVDSDESITRQVPRKIAETKLADVRPIVLQKWLDECGSGLSPNTVRKRYKRLRVALKKAVAWRLIAENPLDAVVPPKPKPTQMKALSEDETVALLELVAGTRYQTAALVAVTTGLRAGELLRVRWEDVDLDAAELRVRRTKAVKSGDLPTITLMAATVAELRDHKRRQAEQRLAARTWHDEGLVFPYKDGGPWVRTTFANGWIRLRTGVRFHDLRHTHATQLLRAGVRLDAVSKRLGHASSAITAEVYAHVLADDDALAVERLELSLGTMLPASSGT